MLEYFPPNQTFIFLILFFASLLAIAAMFWRKLFLLQNGRIQSGAQTASEAPTETPFLERAKTFAVQNLKKYEHIILVETLRFYIRFSNFAKDRYLRIKRTILRKRIGHEKKEISKFLKIVAEYKHRIRDIKHKIVKEEENL